MTAVIYGSPLHVGLALFLPHALYGTLQQLTLSVTHISHGSSVASTRCPAGARARQRATTRPHFSLAEWTVAAALGAMFIPALAGPLGTMDIVARRRWRRHAHWWRGRAWHAAVIEPRIIHGGVSDVAPLRGDAAEALPGSRSEHGDGQARTHGDTYATEVLNR